MAKVTKINKLLEQNNNNNVKNGMLEVEIVKAKTGEVEKIKVPMMDKTGKGEVMEIGLHDNGMVELKTQKETAMMNMNSLTKAVDMLNKAKRK